ncbi:conserved hypothetical protein [Talaromyces stipitatus ATCC 10500]|uniref:F-box domain-containing protein n=1 Tax=Talaromyces stipitatus (strain ATCC 10500 / CBS 375.48 / QM 6759 / NRRL 1006) TaxID=441959 RepID=B8MV67_TALSN|nr:uncharacterized protein TSTA_008190 [Talaromyces stipitatus ATCC 10500]EED11523.1 conserved hypothetical protein [Talaromyces stipitatus ATCC 10500]
MIVDLPAEILVAVAQNLEFHQDAFNLARCCRRIYSVLFPHIFTTIQSRCPCLGELSQIVHYIIQHPQCAINQTQFCSRMGSLKCEPATLLKALQTICHSEEEKLQWLNDLQDGMAYHPWVALLLVLLPRLQSLELKFEYSSTIEYTSEILDRAIRRQKPFDVQVPFPSLKEVRISWWDTQGGVDPSNALPFFCLPEMRRFYGHMIVGDISQEDNSLDLSSGFSNINEIDLKLSNCDTGFSYLVRACSRLESFSYLHADGIVGGPDGFNPQVFYPPLYCHRDSLRKLKLLFDRDAGHCYCGYPKEDLFFGSLAEFSVLTEIDLRSPNIMSWEDERKEVLKLPLTEILPSSVEILSLEDTSPSQLDSLVPQLEAVIRNKRTFFPSLSNLSIEGDFHKQPQINFREWSWGLVRPPRRVIEPEFIDRTQNLRVLCQAMDVDFCLWDRHCKEPKYRIYSRPIPDTTLQRR